MAAGYQLVVIATSPFHDTSIACGPYREGSRRLEEASQELTAQGWNVEICELRKVSDIPTLTDDEGAEP